ncbi:hypothetical protein SBADM41S_02917 [Streptomyces badius]
MVGDLGQVYRETAASIVCLWALTGFRSHAHWLTSPARQPFAGHRAGRRRRSMAVLPCAPSVWIWCAAPPGGAWAPR